MGKFPLLLLGALLGGLGIVVYVYAPSWGDRATTAATNTIADIETHANDLQSAAHNAEQRRLDEQAWAQIHATQTAVAVEASERSTAAAIAAEDQRARMAAKNAAALATATAITREAEALAAAPIAPVAPSPTTSGPGLWWFLFFWGLPLLLLGLGGVGLFGLYKRVARMAGSHAQTVEIIEVRGEIEAARARAANPPPVPHTISLTHNPSWHDARRVDWRGQPAAGGQVAPAQADGGQLAEPANLPGMVDLAQLHHRPTVHSILLGLGPGGQPITVSAKNLMHTGLIGATGGGKSNAGRLLLAQLLACGVPCVLADPHYTDYDPESGDDWSPIARRLHMAPAYQPGAIADLFTWLTEEMARRYDRRKAGEKVGAAIVAYVDELPAIVADVPGAMNTLGKLLREGRKVGLYLVTSSQDLLASTLKTGGEVRENLRTAFYLGGAGDSVVRLLDMPRREISTYEHQLGQGVALLRSSATSPAQLVRVPLASNHGIAGLLSDNHPTMPRVAAQEEAGTVPGQHPDSTPPEPATALERRILDLWLSGVGVNEIIRQVYDVDPAKGGRKVPPLREEVEQVIRARLRHKTVGA